MHNGSVGYSGPLSNSNQFGSYHHAAYREQQPQQIYYANDDLVRLNATSFDTSTF